MLMVWHFFRYICRESKGDENEITSNACVEVMGTNEREIFILEAFQLRRERWLEKRKKNG